MADYPSGHILSGRSCDMPSCHARIEIDGRGCRVTWSALVHMVMHICSAAAAQVPRFDRVRRSGQRDELCVPCFCALPVPGPPLPLPLPSSSTSLVCQDNVKDTGRRAGPSARRSTPPVVPQGCCLAVRSWAAGGRERARWAIAIASARACACACPSALVLPARGAADRTVRGPLRPRTRSPVAVRRPAPARRRRVPAAPPGQRVRRGAGVVAAPRR